LGEHVGFGGKNPIGPGKRSLKRYVRTCNNLKNLSQSTGSGIDLAFTLLKDVTSDQTVWSIVYNITERKVYFKSEDATEVKMLSLADFSFECQSPVLTVDLNIHQKGDIRQRFSPFNKENNSKRVMETFEEIEFLTETPEYLKKGMVDYPNTTTCLNE
jgi:penicillin V acylase-like amidase (Ntn superfamily)